MSASSWSCVTRIARRARVAQDQLDLAPQVGAQRRVEARERLVQQHHVGAGSERAGERDALALAARELVRVAVRLVLEADELERALRARAIVTRAAERDVALDGEVREERVVLEDHPDPALLGRRPRCGRPRRGWPPTVTLPPSRPLEARDQAQQGRLAAAGGAEDGEELAGVHGERDLVDGVRQAEALRDIFELERSPVLGKPKT